MRRRGRRGRGRWRRLLLLLHVLADLLMMAMLLLRLVEWREVLRKPLSLGRTKVRRAWLEVGMTRVIGWRQYAPVARNVHETVVQLLLLLPQVRGHSRRMVALLRHCWNSRDGAEETSETGVIFVPRWLADGRAEVSMEETRVSDDLDGLGEVGMQKAQSETED